MLIPLVENMRQQDLHSQGAWTSLFKIFNESIERRDREKNHLREDDTTWYNLDISLEEIGLEKISGIRETTWIRYLLKNNIKNFEVSERPHG